MITMTEIAKLTGVSQPTVSRVLNGNQAVNPEIRERVLACARKYDFQPNVIAKSLVGNKTFLMGVVLTDISNAFFADLVKYIELEAGKAGYSLILFNSNYDVEHEKECLDVVRRYRVDGLIAVPVQEDSRIWKKAIGRLDVPTVVITRQAKGMDSFYVDHEEAGFQVGKHLKEEGYDSFLFFGNTWDVKYKGFVSAFDQKGEQPVLPLSVITSKDKAEIKDSLKAHFRKYQGKTGIFAYNDRRATQMLGILQEMGILVPDQVGVVGFDDTYICDYLYPRLSSVAQPNEKMAALAVQRLLYKISHPEDATIEDRPLQAELILRESSMLYNGS